MQYLSKFWGPIFKIKKHFQEFIWNHKTLPVAKAILRNKYTAGSTAISNLKIFYKAIMIKTAWYWHKHRQKEQQIKSEIKK